MAVLLITLLRGMRQSGSKETKVDILVTPLTTICIGCGTAMLLAPGIGWAASSLGGIIMWATELQPFFMGIIVSVVVGVALTSSYQQRSNLCSVILNWTGWRCSRRRMLCADGWLCCDELPGKPLGRFICPGTWNLHAANGQYCQKSPHLDSSHVSICHHRTIGYLCIPAPDEWGSSFFWNGDLRPGRARSGFIPVGFRILKQE